jgi:hypothetical protein
MVAAAIGRELLQRDPTGPMLAAISQGMQGKSPDAALIATLILSSPEFQRR